MNIALDTAGLKIAVGDTVTVKARIPNPERNALHPWIKVDRKGTVHAILSNGLVTVYLAHSGMTIRRAGNKVTKL